MTSKTQPADYAQARRLVRDGVTINACIMAAMLEADQVAADCNDIEPIRRLRGAFPEIWQDMQERKEDKRGRTLAERGGIRQEHPTASEEPAAKQKGRKSE